MTQLIQAYCPVSAEGKPRIIFVHGLDGHFRHTWMADKKDEATLWPKWIGQESGAPVWLFGYDSAKTRWFGDAMSLPQVANAFLDTLSSEPAIANGDGPILLVGHSLGGLVIKLAFVAALTQGIEHHERLCKRVKGIVFVGTPHFGSLWASIVSLSHLARPNPQMRNLRLHDEYLAEQHVTFRNLVEDNEVHTQTYVETKPMRLPYIGRLLPGVTIVNPTSSEPHLPRQKAATIEAHHLNICKPKDRHAQIHKSFMRFLGTVSAECALAVNPQHNSASDSIEAISPAERKETETHLTFAMFGDGPQAQSSSCVAVCVVTDSPVQLLTQLLELCKTVQSDLMVDTQAKQRTQGASLGQLLLDVGTRDVALRELATISFGAYIYYCDRDSFDNMNIDERSVKFITRPLMHRLSKRGEKVVEFHSNLGDAEKYLQSALEKVKADFHRNLEMPKHGRQKFLIFTELAQFIAQASGQYLSDMQSAETSKIFQYLRTRIRFAENVSTGKVHTRDSNPIP